tara:strand:+ start:33907 stop:34473 length:567 start_codon:yes stop_codon:yes gene_type:complete
MKNINRYKKKKGYPGWLWMFFGLLIGLSLTLSIYIKDNKLIIKESNSVEAPIEIRNSKEKDLKPKLNKNMKEKFIEDRFDFYKMLPAFEIIITDEDSSPNLNIKPDTISNPGVYLLQAGAFSTRFDADRRSAELKLHKINSHIQHAIVNDRNFFRVFIGPIGNLEELNKLREILWRAEIDVIHIKIGD